MLWFSLFLALVGPVSEVRLDNKGRYLGPLGSSMVYLNHDGTYMAATSYQLWHWDGQGRIINVIGEKGEGPGEFRHVGEVLWTGSHYWIVDGQLLRSSVFDEEGKYLSRSDVFFRQFVPVENRMFVLDLSRFRMFERVYPPSLREIEYQITEAGDLNVNKTDLFFRKMTPAQADFRGNFKLLWVVRDRNRLLIMDQLEPKMQIYDPATIEREHNVSDEDAFEPSFVPVQLSRFVKAKGSMPRTRSHRDYVHWWYAWSRINYFGRLGKDLVVCYSIPIEGDPESEKQVVQRVGFDGRAIGKPLVLDGLMMGVVDERVYVFYEDEDREDFTYFVRAFTL